MSSFLDNSGDIILDAVLTDIGRLRLSQGQFQISKYALGDDEISYTLYKKNHPSGSAYADLEILQTPVLQANTLSNANINYGLLSLARNDILYMPSLKVNNLIDDGINSYNRIYYLAVNDESDEKLEVHLSGANYNLWSGQGSDPAIVIESGLDTPELKGTAANRGTYLVGLNLVDTSFDVSCDSRFVAGVMGPAGAGSFRNNSDGSRTISFGELTVVNAGTATQGLANYSNFSVKGIDDLIYFYGAATTGDTATSVLRGPRGTATKINLVVADGLEGRVGGNRSEKYQQYGAINQTLFGGNELYDYIDTLVYINGSNTGATLQLPVRILRYAGT